MSEAEPPGEMPIDHRKHADWLAVTNNHGTERRIHRVDEDAHDLEQLRNGDPVEVACSTSLISETSNWKAKPAGVFPPGYHPVCTDPECFGDAVDDA